MYLKVGSRFLVSVFKTVDLGVSYFHPLTFLYLRSRRKQGLCFWVHTRDTFLSSDRFRLPRREESVSHRIPLSHIEISCPLLYTIYNVIFQWQKEKHHEKVSHLGTGCQRRTPNHWIPHDPLPWESSPWSQEYYLLPSLLSTVQKFSRLLHTYSR